MKTLEELKQEVLNEYDDKVIALAQHLELDIDFDESDYELNPDEEFENEEEKQERLEELKQEKQEALDEAIDTFRGELDSIVEGHSNMFSYYNEDYYVLTDSEADDMEDEYLDEYIDQCLEIPDNIRPYFDEEKWKDDARMDGRGHIIAHYDGAEYEEKVNGEWYYIYRID